MIVGTSTNAKILTQTIDYQEGTTILEGFLAYETKGPKKKAGVIVVHEWMGLGDYAKRRAMELAALGYVAFAADIYGKGVRAKSQEEAAKLAGHYKGDRALLRRRIEAALNKLGSMKMVDKQRIAALGYCFGGTTVLELARSGADVRGVISFHGGLSTTMPAESKKIRARVLALHGADDPYVPKEEVATFQEEMRSAGADWEFVSYGGAVHSFTVPDAGTDPTKGAAYHALADKRSWEAMRVFLKEVLR